VSCGQAHSSVRQLVAQGSEAKLVASTLGISRSSLYYKAKPRSSRANPSLDAVIVEACGDKPVFGYRRITLCLQRKQGLEVNGKRVLRVMRERGLLRSAHNALLPYQSLSTPLVQFSPGRPQTLCL
jgi:transposase